MEESSREGVKISLRVNGEDFGKGVLLQQRGASTEIQPLFELMITTEAVLETLESTGTCSARLRCLHIPLNPRRQRSEWKPEATTRPGRTLGGRQLLTAGSWQCQQRCIMTCTVRN